MIYCRTVSVFLQFAILTVLLAGPFTILHAGSSHDLILKSANSNENTYSGGQFVSILRGNVVFAFDDITIRSGEATWWRNRGEINFRDGVKVEQGKQTITCDRMHFTRQGNVITSTGRFDFHDPVERTRLTGNEAHYHIESKYFELNGSPRLVRYDTLSAETLFITGMRMSYIDSLKKATVHDSVRIIKGRLLSLCKRADYFTEKNISMLRGAPSVFYEAHNISGDSIDLFFTNEALEGASVSGNATGVYADTSDTSDTLFTRIWSDSLFMSVSDSGFLDTLYAFGKVLSRYYRAARPDMANEARGKTMVLAFNTQGKVNDLSIHGNARSIYFIEEKGGEGRNEASGDMIHVFFSGGKASRLLLSGSARGVYYPQIARNGG